MTSECLFERCCDKIWTCLVCLACDKKKGEGEGVNCLPNRDFMRKVDKSNNIEVDEE